MRRELVLSGLVANLEVVAHPVRATQQPQRATGEPGAVAVHALVVPAVDVHAHQLLGSNPRVGPDRLLKRGP